MSLLAIIISILLTLVLSVLGLMVFIKKVRIYKVDFLLVNKEANQPDSRRALASFTIYYWNENTMKHHIKQLIDECGDIRYGILDERNSLYKKIDSIMTDKDVHNLHIEYEITTVKPR